MTLGKKPDGHLGLLTMHVRECLNLPVSREAFRNSEVESYSVPVPPAGEDRGGTPIATQGKSKPFKQRPGDQKPSLDLC